MLYPLKFTPLLKSIIWGGNKISKYKQIQPELAGIGESWEISGVPNNVSVVANGELKGKPLSELITSYKERLLGTKVYQQFGETFPLLIKFIDAEQDLSVQVHPNDEIAKKRHNSFGKTEMWYIVKAEENAYLYAGLSKEMLPQQFTQSVEDDSFINYLRKYSVQQGDTFFIPAGCVHAIGSGCFILEIQQTSDVTYRIYDYNRKDKDGNSRELHVEEAKDVIDYQSSSEAKVNYPKGKEIENLVKSDCFVTNLIEGKQGEVIHLTHDDVFVVYICVEGNVKLTDNKGNTVDIKQGETVLIPAENTHLITILPQEKSKLLETYL